MKLYKDVTFDLTPSASLSKKPIARSWAASTCMGFDIILAYSSSIGTAVKKSLGSSQLSKTILSFPFIIHSALCFAIMTEKASARRSYKKVAWNTRVRGSLGSSLGVVGAHGIDACIPEYN